MSGKKHRNKRRASRAGRAKSSVESTVRYRTNTAEGKEDSKSIGWDSCEASIPLGVSARLTYSLVRSSDTTDDEKEEKEEMENGEEEEEDEEEEESVELNLRPRFIFVSSLCAVCLEKSTLLCERCRMVSYCSATHRTQGTAKHRDLCDGLTAIRTSIVRMLSGESRTQLDAEQYRVFRLQLLAILESKVGRPLELWEREIVLYPRVCRTCRRFCDKLVCCSHCGMEYFCDEHVDSRKDSKWCAEFRIFRRYLFLQNAHGSVDPKIPNVRQRTFVALTETNFDELMCKIYGNSTYYREMDCYTYSVLSHVSTIPLTTLYAVQNSCPEWRNKTEWTVHVVGAEFQFEGINLYVWEKLFLHFLPNLERLGLTLIGPELRLPADVPPELLSKVKLCRRCKSGGKAVTVSFRTEQLYHVWTRGASGRVVEPDLVCAFNPGLYRETGFAGKDTWLETIREFCKSATPVVVTAYTADEMFREMTRIKSVADVEILLQPRRNPFASVRPDRNFVSDDVDPLIYKNCYISIVRGKTCLPL